MDALPVAGYYRVSVAREGMIAPEIYEAEIARYCEFKRKRGKREANEPSATLVSGTNTASVSGRDATNPHGLGPL